ncbi:uncharacterized protein A1O9_11471 [Exophiala aquamarina CBS 119918]|uniref:WKF domain-containing protein n=1 Tax=Exophiala aquamarina CBS 119918 TaxID=1182545 RepID=A0A072P040_9EURO|nr:uncharacterized protein A1O9_11471 [Exophiala aquamarina CBS 119918]KEF52628.1 hypothetical protein A1O9_11471 [Exophiala aquamarina CBS 119918]
MASVTGPAWKRLGLKLKFAEQAAPERRKRSASNGHDSVRESRPNQSPTQFEGDSPQSTKKKRKTSKHETNLTRPEQANPILELPLASNGDDTRSKRPKKQVSFSSDTKKNVETPAPSSTQPQHVDPKIPQSKSKSKFAKLQTFVKKSTPALDYLSQYYSGRSSWKFNKNRETWLLKHIFSVVDVPRQYDLPIARYIHGLQGNNARQRLKTESEKRLRDEGSTANGEARRQEDPTKDEEYRKRFFQDLDGREDSSKLEDVDESDEYRRWVQRHPRAEILLWALVGSSLPTSTEELQESSASLSKAKKRKNRTTIVEYDSSSSSDGDEDSSSSSDVTSSDDESSTS